MTTNEERIICKVISEGTVAPLVNRNVTPSWFFNSDQRAACKFILDHAAKYGRVPTRATFLSHFGSTYKLFTVAEDFDYLLDTQAKACRYMTAKRLLPTVEDLLGDGDVDDAILAIQKAVSAAESYLPAATNLVDTMDNERLDEAYDNYLIRESGKSLLGMETGFPTIDKATMGLQPGQLVTILAQPKVGKSTLAMAIANHCYLKYRVPVLFFSMEMSAFELEIRQHSMLANLNFKQLQEGSLSLADKQAYIDWLADAKTNHNWAYWILDSASGTTVGSIRSHIERYNPGIVIVDGVYMMADDVTGEVGTPQALTNVTRALKRLAAESGLTIIITHQALAWKSNKTRISMDSAGYSSSFGQDSDVILGLERIQPGKNDEEADYDDQRILRVLASRNSGRATVDLDFDYSEGRFQEVV